MIDTSKLCTDFERASMTLLTDAPLSAYSTFRIGGKAAALVLPENEAGIINAITAATQCGIKFIIIGNGSNLLFSDDGYDGLVISTTNMKSIAFDGDIMTAQCGVALSQMALSCSRAGLSGFEFAYGIPGTCGGAVFMNAGAYGGQISDTVTAVRCLDTKSMSVRTVMKRDAGFEYRNSLFMHDASLVILSADFKLTTGEKNDIENLMRENMKKRRDKQPLEYPSAGSAFKRCEGHFMGKLIEDSGLKGYSVGGAQVSQKHAGFIINTGKATAADVLSLIEHIKKVLKNDYAIDAECEIRYIEK